MVKDYVLKRTRYWAEEMAKHDSQVSFVSILGLFCLYTSIARYWAEEMANHDSQVS